MGVKSWSTEEPISKEALSVFIVLLASMGFDPNSVVVDVVLSCMGMSVLRGSRVIQAVNDNAAII